MLIWLWSAFSNLIYKELPDFLATHKMLKSSKAIERNLRESKQLCNFFFFHIGPLLRFTWLSTGVWGGQSIFYQYSSILDVDLESLEDKKTHCQSGVQSSRWGRSSGLLGCISSHKQSGQWAPHPPPPLPQHGQNQTWTQRRVSLSWREVQKAWGWRLPASWKLSSVAWAWGHTVKLLVHALNLYFYLKDLQIDLWEGRLLALCSRELPRSGSVLHIVGAELIFVG